VIAMSVRDTQKRTIAQRGKVRRKVRAHRENRKSQTILLHLSHQERNADGASGQKKEAGGRTQRNGNGIERVAKSPTAPRKN